jgi:hypothetical protein
VANFLQPIEGALINRNGFSGVGVAKQISEFASGHGNIRPAGVVVGVTCGQGVGLLEGASQKSRGFLLASHVYAVVFAQDHRLAPKRGHKG